MPTPPEKIRDGLYVKKSFDGYRVVYPMKKDIDATPEPFSSGWFKNINWFNLLTGGNWWKLIKIALIVSLLLFSVWAYRRDTQVCQELGTTICNNLVNITMMCSHYGSFLFPSLNESQIASLNISKGSVVEDEQ